MSDWKEMKKAHYKSNTVVMSSYGTIDFNPDSLRKVVGAERITYDEYLIFKCNRVCQLDIRLNNVMGCAYYKQGRRKDELKIC